MNTFEELTPAQTYPKMKELAETAREQLDSQIAFLRERRGSDHSGSEISYYVKDSNTLTTIILQLDELIAEGIA